MENKNSAPVGSAAGLRRSLTLWDLVLYGVIVVQPVAPMSVFGVLSDRSHGYAVTTILIAMVAMLFTAISYGRMARVYPSAGSAFTYVGQEISPALGYITGWGMVMDYLLNPMICIIWCSQQAHVFAPHVAYWAWAIFFAAVFTGLNIQGVKSSARVNFGLAVAMGVVIAIFFVVAARYIFGHHGGAGYFWHPFYDPATWNTKAVLGGTSIAVLTYIGFDGISTLSEEVENPRRNILLATVLTCLVIGILSAIQVYAAQLIWPASEAFPNVDTAFVHVAARAWHPMFIIVGFTLLVANFGSGMGAQLGAARLLYGMGRSEAIPKSFFGKVDPKRHVPRNNVHFCRADRAGRSLHHELCTGSGNVELWRADRVYGCQCRSLRALLCSRRRKEDHSLHSAGDGLLYLPVAVAESEPYGDHRGCHLDGCRNQLRRLENAWIPQKPDQF